METNTDEVPIDIPVEEEDIELPNRPVNDMFSIYSDLSDLPPELVKELNLDSEYQIDRNILALLDKAGGTLNVSELLIGYYRWYSEIKTRQYIIGKLYRMAKKGLVEPTGRKGEYRVSKPNPSKK